MLTIRSRGDYRNTEKFLKKGSEMKIQSTLEKYGRLGAQALASATPVRTGATASSWDYEIEYGNGFYSIHYTNTNINKNVNIALILEYGHGTRNGGYVQGRDYINPALDPILKDLADEAWREVTS